METEAVTAVVANILISVATVVGAYAALRGLNTWRKQLRWQADHDLGRRLLVSTYQHRDALDGVRNPGMFLNIRREPLTEGKGEDSYSQRLFEARLKEYEDRWEKVQEARARLYPDLLEAEATWGSKIRSLYKEILSLENNLYFALSDHLSSSNPQHRHVSGSIEKEERRENLRVINSRGKDDEFNAELESRVQAIEEYVESKIGRGS